MDANESQTSNVHSPVGTNTGGPKARSVYKPPPNKYAGNAVLKRDRKEAAHTNVLAARNQLLSLISDMGPPHGENDVACDQGAQATITPNLLSPRATSTITGSSGASRSPSRSPRSSPRRSPRSHAIKNISVPSLHIGQVNNVVIPMPILSSSASNSVPARLMDDGREGVEEPIGIFSPNTLLASLFARSERGAASSKRETSPLRLQYYASRARLVGDNIVSAQEDDRLAGVGDEPVQVSRRDKISSVLLSIPYNATNREPTADRGALFRRMFGDRPVSQLRPSDDDVDGQVGQAEAESGVTTEPSTGQQQDLLIYPPSVATFPAKFGVLTERDFQELRRKHQLASVGRRDASSILRFERNVLEGVVSDRAFTGADLITAHHQFAHPDGEIAGPELEKNRSSFRRKPNGGRNNSDVSKADNNSADKSSNKSKIESAASFLLRGIEKGHMTDLSLGELLDNDDEKDSGDGSYSSMGTDESGSSASSSEFRVHSAREEHKADREESYAAKNESEKKTGKSTHKKPTKEDDFYLQIQALRQHYNRRLRKETKRRKQKRELEDEDDEDEGSDLQLVGDDGAPITPRALQQQRAGKIKAALWLFGDDLYLARKQHHDRIRIQKEQSKQSILLKQAERLRNVTTETKQHHRWFMKQPVYSSAVVTLYNMPYVEKEEYRQRSTIAALSVDPVWAPEPYHPYKSFAKLFFDHPLAPLSHFTLSAAQLQFYNAIQNSRLGKAGGGTSRRQTPQAAAAANQLLPITSRQIAGLTARTNEKAKQFRASASSLGKSAHLIGDGGVLEGATSRSGTMKTAGADFNHMSSSGQPFVFSPRDMLAVSVGGGGGLMSARSTASSPRRLALQRMLQGSSKLVIRPSIVPPMFELNKFHVIVYSNNTYSLMKAAQFMALVAPTPVMTPASGGGGSTSGASPRSAGHGGGFDTNDISMSMATSRGQGQDRDGGSLSPSNHDANEASFNDLSMTSVSAMSTSRRPGNTNPLVGNKQSSAYGGLGGTFGNLGGGVSSSMVDPSSLAFLFNQWSLALEADLKRYKEPSAILRAYRLWCRMHPFGEVTKAWVVKRLLRWAGKARRSALRYAILRARLLVANERPAITAMERNRQLQAQARQLRKTAGLVGGAVDSVTPPALLRSPLSTSGAQTPLAEGSMPSTPSAFSAGLMGSSRSGVTSPSHQLTAHSLAKEFAGVSCHIVAFPAAALSDFRVWAQGIGNSIYKESQRQHADAQQLLKDKKGGGDASPLMLQSGKSPKAGVLAIPSSPQLRRVSKSSNNVEDAPPPPDLYRLPPLIMPIASGAYIPAHTPTQLAAHSSALVLCSQSQVSVFDHFTDGNEGAIERERLRLEQADRDEAARILREEEEARHNNSFSRSKSRPLTTDVTAVHHPSGLAGIASEPSSLQSSPRGINWSSSNNANHQHLQSGTPVSPSATPVTQPPPPIDTRSQKGVRKLISDKFVETIFEINDLLVARRNVAAEEGRQVIAQQKDWQRQQIESANSEAIMGGVSTTDEINASLSQMPLSARKQQNGGAPNHLNANFFSKGNAGAQSLGINFKQYMPTSLSQEEKAKHNPTGSAIEESLTILQKFLIKNIISIDEKGLADVGGGSAAGASGKGKHSHSHTNAAFLGTYSIRQLLADVLTDMPTTAPAVLPSMADEVSEELAREDAEEAAREAKKAAHGTGTSGPQSKKPATGKKPFQKKQHTAKKVPLTAGPNNVSTDDQLADGGAMVLSQEPSQYLVPTAEHADTYIQMAATGAATHMLDGVFSEYFVAVGDDATGGGDQGAIFGQTPMSKGKKTALAPRRTSLTKPARPAVASAVDAASAEGSEIRNGKYATLTSTLFVQTSGRIGPASSGLDGSAAGIIGGGGSAGGVPVCSGFPAFAGGGGVSAKFIPLQNSYDDVTTAVLRQRERCLLDPQVAEEVLGLYSSIVDAMSAIENDHLSSQHATGKQRGKSSLRSGASVSTVGGKRSAKFADNKKDSHAKHHEAEESVNEALTTRSKLKAKRRDHQLLTSRATGRQTSRGARAVNDHAQPDEDLWGNGDEEDNGDEDDEGLWGQLETSEDDDGDDESNADGTTRRRKKVNKVPLPQFHGVLRSLLDRCTRRLFSILLSLMSTALHPDNNIGNKIEPATKELEGGQRLSTTTTTSPTSQSTSPPVFRVLAGGFLSNSLVLRKAGHLLSPSPSINKSAAPKLVVRGTMSPLALTLAGWYWLCDSMATASEIWHTVAPPSLLPPPPPGMTGTSMTPNILSARGVAAAAASVDVNSSSLSLGRAASMSIPSLSIGLGQGSPTATNNTFFQQRASPTTVSPTMNFANAPNANTSSTPSSSSKYAQIVHAASCVLLADDSRAAQLAVASEASQQQHLHRSSIGASSIASTSNAIGAGGRPPAIVPGLKLRSSKTGTPASVVSSTTNAAKDSALLTNIPPVTSTGGLFEALSVPAMADWYLPSSTVYNIISVAEILPLADEDYQIMCSLFFVDTGISVGGLEGGAGASVGAPPTLGNATGRSRSSSVSSEASAGASFGALPQVASSSLSQKGKNIRQPSTSVSRTASMQQQQSAVSQIPWSDGIRKHHFVLTALHILDLGMAEVDLSMYHQDPMPSTAYSGLKPLSADLIRKGAIKPYNPDWYAYRDEQHQEQQQALKLVPSVSAPQQQQEATESKVTIQATGGSRSNNGKPPTPPPIVTVDSSETVVPTPAPTATATQALGITAAPLATSTAAYRVQQQGPIQLPPLTSEQEAFTLESVMASLTHCPSALLLSPSVSAQANLHVKFTVARFRVQLNPESYAAEIRRVSLALNERQILDDLFDDVLVALQDTFRDKFQRAREAFHRAKKTERLALQQKRVEEKQLMRVIPGTTSDASGRPRVIANQIVLTAQSEAQKKLDREAVADVDSILKEAPSRQECRNVLEWVWSTEFRRGHVEPFLQLAQQTAQGSFPTTSAAASLMSSQGLAVGGPSLPATNQPVTPSPHVSSSFCDRCHKKLQLMYYVHANQPRKVPLIGPDGQPEVMVISAAEPSSFMLRTRQGQEILQGLSDEKRLLAVVSSGVSSNVPKGSSALHSYSLPVLSVPKTTTVLQDNAICEACISSYLGDYIGAALTSNAKERQRMKAEAAAAAKRAAEEKEEAERESQRLDEIRIAEEEAAKKREEDRKKAMSELGLSDPDALENYSVVGANSLMLDDALAGLDASAEMEMNKLNPDDWAKIGRLVKNKQEMIDADNARTKAMLNGNLSQHERMLALKLQEQQRELMTKRTARGNVRPHEDDIDDENEGSGVGESLFARKNTMQRLELKLRKVELQLKRTEAFEVDMREEIIEEEKTAWLDYQILHMEEEEAEIDRQIVLKGHRTEAEKIEDERRRRRAAEALRDAKNQSEKAKRSLANKMAANKRSSTAGTEQDMLDEDETLLGEGGGLVELGDAVQSDEEASTSRGNDGQASDASELSIDSQNEGTDASKGRKGSKAGKKGKRKGSKKGSKQGADNADEESGDEAEGKNKRNKYEIALAEIDAKIQAISARMAIYYTGGPSTDPNLTPEQAIESLRQQSLELYKERGRILSEQKAEEDAKRKKIEEKQRLEDAKKNKSKGGKQRKSESNSRSSASISKGSVSFDLKATHSTTESITGNLPPAALLPLDAKLRNTSLRVSALKKSSLDQDAFGETQPGGMALPNLNNSASTNEELGSGNSHGGSGTSRGGEGLANSSDFVFSPTRKSKRDSNQSSSLSISAVDGDANEASGSANMWNFGGAGQRRDSEATTNDGDGDGDDPLGISSGRSATTANDAMARTNLLRRSVVGTMTMKEFEAARNADSRGRKGSHELDDGPMGEDGSASFMQQKEAAKRERRLVRLREKRGLPPDASISTDSIESFSSQDSDAETTKLEGSHLTSGSRSHRTPRTARVSDGVADPSHSYRTQSGSLKHPNAPPPTSSTLRSVSTPATDSLLPTEVNTSLQEESDEEDSPSESEVAVLTPEQKAAAAEKERLKAAKKASKKAKLDKAAEGALLLAAKYRQAHEDENSGSSGEDNDDDAMSDNGDNDTAADPKDRTPTAESLAIAQEKQMIAAVAHKLIYEAWSSCSDDSTSDDEDEDEEGELEDREGVSPHHDGAANSEPIPSRRIDEPVLPSPKQKGGKLGVDVLDDNTLQQDGAAMVTPSTLTGRPPRPKVAFFSHNGEEIHNPNAATRSSERKQRGAAFGAFLMAASEAVAHRQLTSMAAAPEAVAHLVDEEAEKRQRQLRRAEILKDKKLTRALLGQQRQLDSILGNDSNGGQFIGDGKMLFSLTMTRETAAEVVSIRSPLSFVLPMVLSRPLLGGGNRGGNRTHHHTSSQQVTSNMVVGSEMSYFMLDAGDRLLSTAEVEAREEHIFVATTTTTMTTSIMAITRDGASPRNIHSSSTTSRTQYQHSRKGSFFGNEWAEESAGPAAQSSRATTQHQSQAHSPAPHSLTRAFGFSSKASVSNAHLHPHSQLESGDGGLGDLSVRSDSGMIGASVPPPHPTAHHQPKGEQAAAQSTGDTAPSGGGEITTPTKGGGWSIRPGTGALGSHEDYSWLPEGSSRPLFPVQMLSATEASFMASEGSPFYDPVANNNNDSPSSAALNASGSKRYRHHHLIRSVEAEEKAAARDALAAKAGKVWGRDMVANRATAAAGSARGALISQRVVAERSQFESPGDDHTSTNSAPLQPFYRPHQYAARASSPFEVSMAAAGGNISRRGSNLPGGNTSQLNAKNQRQLQLQVAGAADRLLVKIRFALGSRDHQPSTLSTSSAAANTKSSLSQEIVPAHTALANLLASFSEADMQLQVLFRATYVETCALHGALALRLMGPKDRSLQARNVAREARMMMGIANNNLANGDLPSLRDRNTVKNFATQFATVGFLSTQRPVLLSTPTITLPTNPNEVAMHPIHQSPSSPLNNGAASVRYHRNPSILVCVESHSAFVAYAAVLAHSKITLAEKSLFQLPQHQLQQQAPMLAAAATSSTAGGSRKGSFVRPPSSSKPSTPLTSAQSSAPPATYLDLRQLGTLINVNNGRAFALLVGQQGCSTLSTTLLMSIQRGVLGSVNRHLIAGHDKRRKMRILLAQRNEGFAAQRRRSRSITASQFNASVGGNRSGSSSPQSLGSSITSMSTSLSPNGTLSPNRGIGVSSSSRRQNEKNNSKVNVLSVDNLTSMSGSSHIGNVTRCYRGVHTLTRNAWQQLRPYVSANASRVATLLLKVREGKELRRADLIAGLLSLPANRLMGEAATSTTSVSTPSFATLPTTIAPVDAARTMLWQARLSLLSVLGAHYLQLVGPIGGVHPLAPSHYLVNAWAPTIPGNTSVLLSAVSPRKISGGSHPLFRPAAVPASSIVEAVFISSLSTLRQAIAEMADRQLKRQQAREINLFETRRALLVSAGEDSPLVIGGEETSTNNQIDATDSEDAFGDANLHKASHSNSLAAGSTTSTIAFSNLPHSTAGPTSTPSMVSIPLISIKAGSAASSPRFINTNATFSTSTVPRLDEAAMTTARSTADSNNPTATAVFGRKTRTLLEHRILLRLALADALEQFQIIHDGSVSGSGGAGASAAAGIGAMSVGDSVAAGASLYSELPIPSTLEPDQVANLTHIKAAIAAQREALDLSDLKLFDDDAEEYFRFTAPLLPTYKAFVSAATALGRSFQLAAAEDTVTSYMLSRQDVANGPEQQSPPTTSTIAIRKERVLSDVLRVTEPSARRRLFAEVIDKCPCWAATRAEREAAMASAPTSPSQQDLAIPDAHDATSAGLDLDATASPSSPRTSPPAPSVKEVECARFLAQLGKVAQSMSLLAHSREAEALLLTWGAPTASLSMRSVMDKSNWADWCYEAAGTNTTTVAAHVYHRELVAAATNASRKRRGGRRSGVNKGGGGGGILVKASKSAKTGSSPTNVSQQQSPVSASAAPSQQSNNAILQSQLQSLTDSIANGSMLDAVKAVAWGERVFEASSVASVVAFSSQPTNSYNPKLVSSPGSTVQSPPTTGTTPQPDAKLSPASTTIDWSSELWRALHLHQSTQSTLLVYRKTEAAKRGGEGLEGGGTSSRAELVGINKAQSLTNLFLRACASVMAQQQQPNTATSSGDDSHPHGHVAKSTGPLTTDKVYQSLGLNQSSLSISSSTLALVPIRRGRFAFGSDHQIASSGSPKDKATETSTSAAMSAVEAFRAPSSTSQAATVGVAPTTSPQSSAANALSVAYLRPTPFTLAASTPLILESDGSGPAATIGHIASQALLYQRLLHDPAPASTMRAWAYDATARATADIPSNTKKAKKGKKAEKDNEKTNPQPQQVVWGIQLALLLLGYPLPSHLSLSTLSSPPNHNKSVLSPTSHSLEKQSLDSATRLLSALAEAVLSASTSRSSAHSDAETQAMVKAMLKSLKYLHKQIAAEEVSLNLKEATAPTDTDIVQRLQQNTPARVVAPPALFSLLPLPSFESCWESLGSGTITHRFAEEIVSGSLPMREIHKRDVFRRILQQVGGSAGGGIREHRQSSSSVAAFTATGGIDSFFSNVMLRGESLQLTLQRESEAAAKRRRVRVKKEEHEQNKRAQRQQQSPLQRKGFTTPTSGTAATPHDPSVTATGSVLSTPPPEGSAYSGVKFSPAAMAARVTDAGRREAILANPKFVGAVSLSGLRGGYSSAPLGGPLPSLARQRKNRLRSQQHPHSAVGGGSSSVSPTLSRFPSQVSLFAPTPHSPTVAHSPTHHPQAIDEDDDYYIYEDEELAQTNADDEAQLAEDEALMRAVMEGEGEGLFENDGDLMGASTATDMRGTSGVGRRSTAISDGGTLMVRNGSISGLGGLHGGFGLKPEVPLHVTTFTADLYRKKNKRSKKDSKKKLTRMIDNVEVELLLGKHKKRHKKNRNGSPGSASESNWSNSEGDDSGSGDTSSTSSSDDESVYSPEHTNLILSHRNTMIEKARATAAAAHKQMLIDTMMATRLAVSGKAIAELQQQQQHGSSLYVGQKQFHFDSGDANPSTNSKPTTPQLTYGRLLPPISAVGAPIPLASGKQLSSSESPSSPFGTMSSHTSIRHSRPQYHLKADLGPILPPKLLPKGATLGEKGLRPELGSGVRGPISPSASREGKRPPHQLPPFLVRSAPSLVPSSSSAPVAPSSAPTVSPKTGALGVTAVLLTPIAQANLPGASPLSRAQAASSAPPMSSLVALSPISPMSPTAVQGSFAAATQQVAGGKQGARVTFAFQEKQGTPTTTQPLVLHPPVPATAPQQQLPPTPAISGSLRTLRGARELLITMEIDELKTGHGPKGQ